MPTRSRRRLRGKGLAYEAAGGDVNYAVRRFPGYGKLSGKSLDELQAGERVAVDEGKPELIGQLLAELARWFEQHAQAADAALAAHLRDVGFDADSGHVECAVGPAAINTCGSERCAA